MAGNHQPYEISHMIHASLHARLYGGSYRLNNNDPWVEVYDPMPFIDFVQSEKERIADVFKKTLPMDEQAIDVEEPGVEAQGMPAIERRRRFRERYTEEREIRGNDYVSRQQVVYKSLSNGRTCAFEYPFIDVFKNCFQEGCKICSFESLDDRMARLAAEIQDPRSKLTILKAYKIPVQQPIEPLDVKSFAFENLHPAEGFRCHFCHQILKTKCTLRAHINHKHVVHAGPPKKRGRPRKPENEKVRREPRPRRTADILTRIKAEPEDPEYPNCSDFPEFAPPRARHGVAISHGVPAQRAPSDDHFLVRYFFVENVQKGDF
ncbi:unnamed protein product, partial [Mesorhabditis spiculigera]